MFIGTLGASFLLNLFIVERVIRIDEVAVKEEEKFWSLVLKQILKFKSTLKMTKASITFLVEIIYLPKKDGVIL